MPQLQSSLPSPDLRPYIRAYAQRKFDPFDQPLREHVPAQLEQILIFELGVLPGVHHHRSEQAGPIWLGGAQTNFSGHLELVPGVVSFAIFFQPTGWSQLFLTPMHELTNHLFDGTLVAGKCMRDLWTCLGEQNTFAERVLQVEALLRTYLQHARRHDRITSAAMHIFRNHGAIRVPHLTLRDTLGLRQFERNFLQQMGMSPKTFARIARFQAALDAKITTPQRSWTDIAHSFGYYDQMHMIHDFQHLGQTTPTKLLTLMGDARPVDLARECPVDNASH